MYYSDSAVLQIICKTVLPILRLLSTLFFRGSSRYEQEKKPTLIGVYIFSTVDFFPTTKVTLLSATGLTSVRNWTLPIKPDLSLEAFYMEPLSH